MMSKIFQLKGYSRGTTVYASNFYKFFLTNYWLYGAKRFWDVNREF